MKPLNLEETRLKEEMKERCLNKGQYIDENAKAKFDMLCHLEDFEIQYWELLKENKILKQNAENNDKVVDKVNWENMLLKKQQKEFIEYMNKTIEELECDDVDDEEMKAYLIQRIDIFKEILKKYNEKVTDINVGNIGDERNEKIDGLE